MVMRTVLVMATVWAGCGGVKLTCQTQPCEATSKSYQVCASVGVGATEQYQFGGASCSCSVSDATGCQACAQRVAVFCGGDVGDGGLGNDMSIHACTMTASGAVTGTVSCSATTVYASGTNLGGPALTPTGAGPMLQAAITRPGMVTSGTWSSSDSGAEGGITANMGGTATWLACQGCSAPQGSWTMNLTVESMSANGEGDAYIATGTIDATLQPVAGTGATGTVTFSASF